MFLTELTANRESMLYIEMWGSESYFQYQKDLLVYDVHGDLRRELEVWSREAEEPDAAESSG